MLVGLIFANMLASSTPAYPSMWCRYDPFLMYFSFNEIRGTVDSQSSAEDMNEEIVEFGEHLRRYPATFVSGKVTWWMGQSARRHRFTLDFASHTLTDERKWGTRNLASKYPCYPISNGA